MSGVLPPIGLPPIGLPPSPNDKPGTGGFMEEPEETLFPLQNDRRNYV